MDEILTGVYHDYSYSYGHDRTYPFSSRYNNTEIEKELKKISNIELPENFKKVVIKLHPEIEDVVADGFNHTKRFSPNTFEPVFFFTVNLKVYFYQDGCPKGNKEYYEELIEDLFKMTYGSEMGFISFKVGFLIIPPAKTNEQKFVELFVRKNET
jgi:hypothetical protein